MNIEKLIVKEIQNLMNSGQSLNGAIHLFCNDFGADLMEVQTIVKPWLSQTRVSIADQFQMAGEPLGDDEG